MGRREVPSQPISALPGSLVRGLANPAEELGPKSLSGTAKPLPTPAWARWSQGRFGSNPGPRPARHHGRVRQVLPLLAGQNLAEPGTQAEPAALALARPGEPAGSSHLAPTWLNRNSIKPCGSHVGRGQPGVVAGPWVGRLAQAAGAEPRRPGVAAGRAGRPRASDERPGIPEPPMAGAVPGGLGRGA